MAATWPFERPRQLTVPAPYSSSKPTGSSKGTDTIRALKEKLNEFKAENTLLGNVVKELKAERDGLSKKLAATREQLTDTSSKAAGAAVELQAANKEQRRLQAEVERLSSVVHSHSIRLQKAKQHQQELEDVAINLQQELEGVKTQLSEAQQAAQQAQQRSVAAEAKLVAAGLGAMPKMGPTAEQLVINSTQRIKELTEELAAAKADAGHQQANWQQQLQQQEQHWQQQVAAVQQQLQDVQAAGGQRRQQQEAELQQQAGRLAESERHVQQLQQMLVGLQASAADGQALEQAKAELQHIKQTMLNQSQSLQQQVLQLQSQLADAQLQHSNTVSDQQQQIMLLERKLAAAQREKQELTSTLVAVRQQESTHRLAVSEATTKVERLRGELVKCVGELQVQLDGSATASQQHTHVLQQLRAMETTAAAARAEAAETRQQLIELASVSIAELRTQVAGEAVGITGLAEDVAGALPLPVSTYIKVLEHAVCDCEQRCKQLLADTLAAQQQEREVRAELETAREQQAAAQRALTQQTQRLLAAEKMRLSDLRETQGLEKRLLLAQQECWTIRDALLAAKSSSTAAAVIAGADAAVAASKGDCYLPTLSLQISRSRESNQGAAAVQQCNGQTAQQQLGFEQKPSQQMWGVTAADAAAAHASSAAAAGAAASKHQSKLEQLRQLKEQFNSKTYARAAPAQQRQQSTNSKELRRSSSGSYAPAGLTMKTQQQQQQEGSVRDATVRTHAAGQIEAFPDIATDRTAAAGRNVGSLQSTSSSSRENSARLIGSHVDGANTRDRNLQRSSSRGPALKANSSMITAAAGVKSAGRRPSDQNDILSPKELDHESSGIYHNTSVAAAAGGGGASSSAHLCAADRAEHVAEGSVMQNAGGSIKQLDTPVWQQQQQQPAWLRDDTEFKGHLYSNGLGDAASAAESWQQDSSLQCEPFDAGVWHP